MEANANSDDDVSFDDNSDEDDMDFFLSYLDEPEESSVTLVPDELPEELPEEINEQTKKSTGTEEPKKPTRAPLAQLKRDSVRTTFICLNQEAFRSQLEIEERKSGIFSPEVARGRTRGNSAARATFINLDTTSLQNQLKSIRKQEENETRSDNSDPPSIQYPGSETTNKATPPRPPRPSRPSRTSDTEQQEEDSSAQQISKIGGRFGKPPPARKPSTANLHAAVKQQIPPAFVELLKTEKDYITNLEIIQNVFLSEIRKQKLLSSYEMVALFSNIEELVPINKKLLEDLSNLENSFVSTKSVGEVFQSHAKNFKKYGVYCTNQPNIHELLIEYKEQYPEFSEFLKKCFKVPACKKQDIESFLMMPLQRLCKYPLLLKELVSYESKTLQKGGPAKSAEHGICVWGNGTQDIQRIDLAQHWSGVACGGLHYAAVSFGNSIYVWGKGKEGQLGLGDSILHREEPTLLPLYSASNIPLKATSIFCGPLQTGVITENDELYLWGALPCGLVFVPTLQLFNGKNRKVKSLSFGVTCIFAILESETSKQDTEVWAWGHSSKGQLGLGKDIFDAKEPTVIHELSAKNIIQISSGETHAACVSASGAVFIWGDNSYNALSLDSSTPACFNPHMVIDLLGKEIIQVECGFMHTFVRSKDKVWSWGYARHGVLGYSSSKESKEMTEITTLENKSITRIVSGGMHAFAVTQEGKTYSWGEGRGYKTCTGTQDDVLVPTLIKELSGYIIKDVACGSQGAIAFYEKFSETQSSIVNLGAGLDDFRAVVTGINDQVRQVENLSALIKITSRIDNGDKLGIVSQHRTSVFEGPLNVEGRSRFGFLMDDLFLICRLPSRSDPRKLYKAYRKLLIKDCKISDISDVVFEIHVENDKKEGLYTLKFAKKDRKMTWWRAITKLGVPVVDIKSKKSSTTTNKTEIDKRKSVKPNNKLKKSNQNVTSSSQRELDEQAIKGLLQKLKRELREEEEARIIAEKHNEVMKILLSDQRNSDKEDLMDDSSLRECEKRIEDLSSLVDKLTAENISLANQEKAMKTELINLRKANGKGIEDLANNIESDSESDSDVSGDE